MSKDKIVNKDEIHYHLKTHYQAISLSSIQHPLKAPFNKDLFHPLIKKNKKEFEGNTLWIRE